MTGQEGRVALITGASRGIGRGVALRLAQAGADIAVNYQKNEMAAAETVAGVEALGRRAKAYQASVDSLEADTAMAEAVLEDFGHVDILVLNGGPTSVGNLVTETDFDEVVLNVSTHAFGAFHLCKLLVPQMRARERGDIIMMSSISTSYIGPRGAPYNMAKAALEALAMTLAHEERDNGIRVNVIAPGITATDMGDFAASYAGVKHATDLDATSPFGRVCRAEDVGDVVAYLVSEQAFYLTGQHIKMDAVRGLNYMI